MGKRALPGQEVLTFDVSSPNVEPSPTFRSGAIEPCHAESTIATRKKRINEFIDYQMDEILHQKLDDNLSESEVQKINEQDRKTRKNLKERPRSFLRRVGGLWVPASQGEITYVVYNSQAVVNENVRSAKERVTKKYEESEPRPSDKQISLWANFSARNIPKDTEDRFRKYNLHANKQFGLLRDDLFVMHKIWDKSQNVLDQDFSGEQVRSTDTAVQGIKNYLISLRSFIGANVSPGEKRSWIHESHTKKIPIAQEWASGYIDNLTNKEVEVVFLEAYYNSFFRWSFWSTIVREIDKRRKIVKTSEPQYIRVPIEVEERTVADYVEERGYRI